MLWIAESGNCSLTWNKWTYKSQTRCRMTFWPLEFLGFYLSWGSTVLAWGCKLFCHFFVRLEIGSCVRLKIENCGNTWKLLSQQKEVRRQQHLLVIDWLEFSLWRKHLCSSKSLVVFEDHSSLWLSSNFHCGECKTSLAFMWIFDFGGWLEDFSVFQFSFFTWVFLILIVTEWLLRLVSHFTRFEKF